MSKYKVSEISVRCDEATIKVIRIRLDGGETGSHYVRWADGTYNCTCMGYMRNEACKHLGVIKRIKNAVIDAYRVPIVEEV